MPTARNNLVVAEELDEAKTALSLLNRISRLAKVHATKHWWQQKPVKHAMIWPDRTRDGLTERKQFQEIIAHLRMLINIVNAKPQRL